MAPMTPPGPAHPAKGKTDGLARVGLGARWGIAITTSNLVYGYVMVASHLPPDPRQDSWPMMQSPFLTYYLTLAYVLGVTWLGPKMMEGREPMAGLRPIMVAYNGFQVVFSAWLVYMLGMGGWFGSYNWRCQACDFSDSPQAITMLHGSYWYYMSKFVDFLDTVFFVLNKKYDHISLLHVVHHSLMPVSMWYGIRYQPGGNSSFMGLLNSFVHVVMYLYYLLAAMGPRVRPYLWWKKYLTSMQMVQFVTVMVHSFQLAFMECEGVPRRFNWWICGNATMFLFLFANFYHQSYSKSKLSTKASVAGKRVTKGVSPAILGEFSSGISSGVSSGITSGSSRRTVPNGVADTACKTLEMCEQMALRSRLGAI